MEQGFTGSRMANEAVIGLRSFLTGSVCGWLPVPAEHAESAEGVPATRLTLSFGKRERQCFIIGAIERPWAVGQAPAFDDFNSFIHARVGRATTGAEIIEGAKDVVVVARRKRELEELRIGDVAGGEAAKEGALQEVLFGPATGGCYASCQRMSGPIACSNSSRPSRTQMVL